MIHGTLEAGPMRFSDLREALGGISPKVLTQALRALERDGLVSRRAYSQPQVPPKVEYALTELGGSLCAPVQGLRAWAEEHIDDIRRAQRLRRRGVGGAGARRLRRAAAGAGRRRCAARPGSRCRRA